MTTFKHKIALTTIKHWGIFMFNINIKSKIFFTSLLTFSFSFSAFAQEVEEVVVTATKKEESTQDIPISIQAFTDENLKAEQIYDMTDLAKLFLVLVLPKALDLVLHIV